MKYEIPRGYLSASSLGTFITCPKQYEFRYVKGLVMPPNAALVTGSVIHKVFETYYKDAMSSSQRLTVEQSAELASDIASDYVKENDIGTTSKEEVGDIQKLAPVITRTYVDKVAQHISPIATEEELRVTMACGVDILGYLDLRHRLEHSEEEVKLAEDNGIELSVEGIADYKITKKKWTLDKLKNSLQFNLYTTLTGIGDVQIHNLTKDIPKPMTRKPRASSSEENGVVDHAGNLRVLHHRFTGDDADHLETMVETAARLITAGTFMPCALDSWCCNSEWCGYWNLCRGHSRSLYMM